MIENENMEEGIRYTVFQVYIYKTYIHVRGLVELLNLGYN